MAPDPQLTYAPLETVRVGGIDIVTASRQDLVAACLADHQAFQHNKAARRPRLVFDANGHALSLRSNDASYRSAIDAADIIHADGGFLVTLSRWFGKATIAERSATTDMIHDLARAAEDKGLRFYLLGGSEALNARCAERLSQIYPRLTIAGRHHGYFADQDLDTIAADICVAAPDIVWVGLGKPREQAVSVRLADTVSATWIITCGGCFNFVTGDYKRAPRWMQAWNVEWIHRLACDPGRLFMRYLVTNPHALWVVMVDQLLQAKGRKLALLKQG
jgi:exopolysaccharide biosynthesis WecB/TagA/CpsF family protein